MHIRFGGMKPIVILGRIMYAKQKYAGYNMHRACVDYCGIRYSDIVADKYVKLDEQWRRKLGGDLSNVR